MMFVETGVLTCRVRINVRFHIDALIAGILDYAQ